MEQRADFFLPRRPGDTDEKVRALLHDDIMRPNGKQTIFQMIQLAKRISEPGGRAPEPLSYKREYLRRLDERIRSRTEGLRSGWLGRDDFLVYGARPLLQNIQDHGFALYLASGTDEVFVRQEAELLDLSRYFGKHIYWAQDDYKKFSKKLVIDRILKDNRITGAQLLAFGDGYVEIQNTKEAGGLAVAVASDEANNGSGHLDEWKRWRLLGVGADVVIPDYRDGDALLDLVFAN